MEIHFYEKPGCINNSRQKALLKQNGHQVRSFDILNQAWTELSLSPFLINRPVPEWFNVNSPLIKTGKIVPERLDYKKAIEELIREPSLIKRPLLWSNGRFDCGFDSDLIAELLNEENRALGHNTKSTEM